MEKKTRIQYLSKMDRDNKCTFFLFWWTDYNPWVKPPHDKEWQEVGQIFYADPLEHGFPRPE